MNRTVNEVVFHCSASIEGNDLQKQDIKNMHTWPCDVFDKSGAYLHTKYMGKKYPARSRLPMDVRNKKGRGWSDIGYHYIVTLNGQIQLGRPLGRSGAHVAGHNHDTIGICYIGGLGLDGKPKDTRTPAQIKSMAFIAKTIHKDLPHVEFKGHRDYSPDRNHDGIITKDEWIKICPCFSVSDWIKTLW